jgi:hypothetical protein
MVKFLTKGSLILLSLCSLRLKYTLQMQAEVVCSKSHINLSGHIVFILLNEQLKENALVLI